MDDHIFGVDQHPVTCARAFDFCVAKAGFFQAAYNFNRHGAYMTLGSAGRDNHCVRNVGLAGKVNGDDVFAFIIVKSMEDEGKNCLASLFGC